MVAETGLPPGWDILWSATKRRPYYYKENGVKWDSTWEPPEGTNEKKRLRYINQKIEASHLLVKHRESRRTSSWREANITRSKEEARAILERHRETILAGTPLPKLAETESDCSSAAKSGDLGVFGFGQMQMPFWKASIALKKGEVSDIVDTASGLHLILRRNDDPPEEEDEEGTGSLEQDGARTESI